MHGRFGQEFGSIAEIETPTGGGVTFVEGFKPLGGKLVAKGRKNLQGGGRRGIQMPRLTGDLSFDRKCGQPFGCGGSNGQSVACHRFLIGARWGRRCWELQRHCIRCASGTETGQSKNSRKLFHRAAPWYSTLGCMATAEATRFDILKKPATDAISQISRSLKPTSRRA